MGSPEPGPPDFPDFRISHSNRENFLMNAKSRNAAVVWILSLVWAAGLSAGFETGATVHGFRLVEKRFVREVNAECLLFEHVKSGARALKIMAADPNKTFSIAFKTVPESDCGTPHIMEHSVLNGSKHFPVKSPFDVLSKGSLNTFLNAMTGNDVTVYPVASMNDKDYFNLMHVYLDAVFNPLIHEDPRILMQEGWHYELTDAAAPLTVKGVVYNEMKGAFSSSLRELDYQVMKRLFPDNAYALSSGGYPPAIPTLTREAFLDFHRRYYHPDNSYIFLYGDADVEKELAFIDSEYLSAYDRTGSTVDIPLQKPFEALREAAAFYPVSEGDSTEHRTYLSLNFAAGLNTDRALVMALQVLRDMLVNQESGPVRLALQEAKIGREVSASVDDLQQNVFTITVQNADPADAPRFRDVVFRTLRDVAQKGPDRKILEGTLNRLEFRLREGDDAQKGITYSMQTLAGWFFAGDPFLGLEYEKPLALLKTAMTSDFLETVLRRHLIDNPHALLMTLAPEPGLETRNAAAADLALAGRKSMLTKAEIDTLVSQTAGLVAYQTREDSPEALATIPLLRLTDINPGAEWFVVEERKVAGVPVLFHDAFTNGVVYASLYFDMQVLPQELIPYAALLSEMLGSLDTGRYPFAELETALNVHTGGFSTATEMFLEDRDDSRLLPKFTVSVKALRPKTGRMFDLAGEVLLRTKFDDPARIRTVLTRHQSRLDGAARRNGYYFAFNRALSYTGAGGAFGEKTRGFEYYWFVSDLADSFDVQAGTIAANLKRTAALLFTSGNLTAAATGGPEESEAFTKAFKQFAKALAPGRPEPQSWTFDIRKRNEGFATPSKVQYVVEGYNMKKLGHSWNGKINVLTQVLSTDWLQTRIRVIGGAYGGFSMINPNGTFLLCSYRDPNLEQTLDTYAATPDYLKSFEADSTAMTRYIIGTVSNLDQPRTASEKGREAVRCRFERVSAADLQAERDAVLSTTAADIRAMAPLVSDVLGQRAFCVYGNEEKIKAAAGVFGTVLNPLR
jgi:Zn-dependent M16 (insulinase) family peptidase